MGTTETRASSVLHVALTEHEARALAYAADFARATFAPLDVAALVAPGENALAAGHLKLLSAIERGEIQPTTRRTT
jgi:hypothetical protein